VPVQRLPDERLRAFGLRLRQIRESKGLSRDELAHAAGVAARQLTRVEHGNASPSVTWLLDVCVALDLHPGELFSTVVNARPSNWMPGQD
jgi:transcriptional regulator with XRE-family HTH domain